MAFDDNLYGTQTPHRLIALLKLVARGRMTSDQLKEYLQPSALTSQKGFEQVYSLARKGELIKEDSDGFIHLQFDSHHLENKQQFRFILSQMVMNQPERLFVRFSTWYLMQGRLVYGMGEDDLVKKFVDDLGSSFNKTKLNGWKGWFIYLGYGYDHNGKVIPNVFGRLRDLMVNDYELPRQIRVPFSTFMSWLNRTCPELDFGEYAINFKGSGVIESKTLSVGLSAGLRALHDTGELTLIYTPDSTDLWHLYRVGTHEIAEQVSAIQIGGSV